MEDPDDDIRDTDEQDYGYPKQNMGDENIAYPQEMPMENMEYNQEQNNQNPQYSQQENPQGNLPPIYAEKIESVKETREHQVKYFEPIEISSEEDVSKYLQSGQLMKQIAPKIMALKQETANQGNNDPSVHTQVTFDLKQNDAIYNNSQKNNEEEKEQNPQNEKLNATSPYMNNKFSANQQANYLSKTQNFMQNQNMEGPGGIKYSSILPPKFAQTKIVTIDQYGNRQEEEAHETEGGEDPIDGDEMENQMQSNNSQQNEELEQQRLQQQQLQQQQLQQQRLQQQQLQQQQLQQQQLQQQQLQQQRLEQLKLQQQQLEQQRIKQQQLQQQQLQQQQLQQQQLQQQQRYLQQQKLQEQQRLQQQQRIQQGINTQYRNSNPASPNIYPYSRAYSDKKLEIHSPFQPANLMATQTQNKINLPQKDPIVQKVYKLSGKLRPRRKLPQMQNNNNLILANQKIQNNNNLILANQKIQNKNLANQKIQNNNNLNLANQKIQNNSNIIWAVQKIQNKWRSHFIKMRFEQIRPQLALEAQNFLNAQYELCDKAGPVASDDDFNLQGWKKFYPPNDPFFSFQKGFVIPTGIKIRHPNDPEKVQVYEGDININNERHGFGRLTTTKSVFLGEWRNDRFTGWGRETRRSGKVLEGKYIDGVVEGKGILRNSKGNTYIGDFSNSKRHGKGTLDTHKVHYEGEFKNDSLSGKGRITFKNEGHVYEGQFDNNEINGFGTFKWKNGDSYTGQMMNGKMHGKGTYRYKNGQVFEGTYANGIKQGKGKIYYLNPNGNQKSMVGKNIDPKGLNMSGMTANTTKFGGGK